VIKFAVLGCGHIGKRHADLIFKHSDAQLVATIDPLSIETLQMSKFAIPHFNNLSEFFSSGIEADVVNICTPNGLHASQAVECLNNGVHVVIEKPIAIHLEDARAIAYAAEANKRLAFPVVQNRYSTAVKWLKELISNQQLGMIYMVQLNCFWNRDERYYQKDGWRGTLEWDGGPLFTQFSHFIDVLLWVFGDIINIEAKFFDFNHEQITEFEDSGIITFDLAAGGVGSISYSTSIYQSNFESSITVIAEKGTAKIGGQYMNSVEYCHVGGAKKPTITDNEIFNDYGSYKGSASNHQQVIDNVIKSIAGIESQDVSLDDGVIVVDIIDKIYQKRKISKIVNKSMSQII
jgi:predicted dehydrogenase